MAHHCHATACTANVPPQMWGCRKHWFMVPKPLRDRIWATYRPGQCNDKQPSVEYLEAAREAVIFVALKDGVEPNTTLYDVFLVAAREREKANESLTLPHKEVPTMTSPATPAATSLPIFAKPIPIIGVTGDFESGKTRFLLSLSPGASTLMFDTETSSATYKEIGFKHIDIPAEMQKLKPQGYTPLDMFQWWHQAVKAIPAGMFRVIALDVAEDIESGLADWVWENPMHFNHTRNQYLKASGIFWGDVKSFWKPLLLDIQSRCEIFAFSVHMGSVWGSDNKPTGAKRPKGKSTLMELATLFLQLERPTLPDGSKVEVPSARVLKTRLSHNVVKDGVLLTKAILPPRLPVCTPEAIKAYIARPADFTRLSAGELDAPKLMTDDERAQVRLATAQAEADAARLRIEVMDMERRGGHGAGAAMAPVTSVEVAADEPDTMTSPVIAEESTESFPPIEAAPSELFTAPEPAPVPEKERREAAEPTTGNGSGTGHEAPSLSQPTATAPTPVNGASSPAPAQATEYVRPKSLPLDPAAAAQTLWEEFSHLQGFTAEQKMGGWKAVMAKYGATSSRDLKADDARALEVLLYDKVKAIYTERGMVGAIPT